jgi:ribosomal protein L11 methyltransferase
LNWLEISITIDGELAEAVADVLSRHIQQGVATELNIDAGKRLPADNQVIVRGYLSLDGSEDELRDRIERDLWHLRQIVDFPDPTYRIVQDRDWSEQWREHYHPMPVGERLLIVPSWFESVENKRLSLTLEPGMAFGTGAHPSTRLSLEELEKSIRRGDRVIDIGCGSGILSIACALLGADKVIALDIEQTATQATMQNAKQNHVSDQIIVIEGSMDKLFEGDRDLREPANIVVVNILANVILNFLEEGLARLLAPGGKMILSGILADQVSQITQAGPEYGLILDKVRGEKDWRAVVFEKKELPPQRGSSELDRDPGG